MTDDTMAPAQNGRIAPRSEETAAAERYFMASQRQLVWRKFKRHRLAVVSLFALLGLYLVAFSYEFWAPYDALTQHKTFLDMAPTQIHLRNSEGKWRPPFVYGYKSALDEQTFQRIYKEDPSKIYPIRFLARGEKVRLWGVVETDIHFFGAGEGKVFLLGTDELGRDLFSRILTASRISLTIGLVGVFLSFVLGCLLGGISGYYGGYPDLVIQRVIEFLGSIPHTPLWMTLSAFIPVNTPILTTYFLITVILSVLSWTGLARVVRGKLLELREQDYVTAARLSGASDMQLILDHLLPGFMSYLIVHLTLAIPGMILGETALSFLGLGIRPPAVSWGTLLQGAQNVNSVVLRPWMLTPALFVIAAVMLFNFIGDGLRDAADPYK